MSIFVCRVGLLNANVLICTTRDTIRLCHLHLRSFSFSVYLGSCSVLRLAFKPMNEGTYKIWLRYLWIFLPGKNISNLGIEPTIPISCFKFKMKFYAKNFHFINYFCNFNLPFAASRYLVSKLMFVIYIFEFDGHRSRLQLQRSEFKSCWSLQFIFRKNCLQRMKINQKQSKLKIIISNQQKVMYYIISFHLFSGNDVIKIVND